MDDHQGTPRLLCVAVAVVLIVGLVPPADYPKVGMSHDAYDEQRGMYSRVLYGNDTYELYSLPEAVYIVNMTNDPQCKKTTCGGPCFYPLCTNTTNWFYNGLITVGVEKAGQWTNNFGSLDMQMVPLVHDRCIPVAYTSVFGTVESKLQYLFTWWRNMKQETFPPTTFQPPAICHGLEDSTTALQASHPRLMSFRSFRFSDGIEASIWLLSEFKGTHFDAKQQGLYLWPGAERLCRFAAYNPHLFAQKRVIELGAGAGLGSAVVAQLGPSELVVTDGSEQVMDLLRRNVNENLNRAAPQRVESGENGGAHQGEDCSMVEQNNGGTTTAVTTKVQVLSLGWSADEEELEAARDSEGRELCHTFDVVLGSDVIYEYANIVPLLTTARALLSDDARAFFVLAYVHRSGYLWDEMRRHAQELGLTCEVESESTGGGGQLGRILIFRKVRS